MTNVQTLSAPTSGLEYNLSNNLTQVYKENHAPFGEIQKSKQHSILNVHKYGIKPKPMHSNTSKAIDPKKRLSMSDVSEMMFQYIKAKAPKNEQQSLLIHKSGQISPASAETHEPSTIAAIATNGAADAMRINTASKNLDGDEMMSTKTTAAISMLRLKENPILNSTPFHPRIKYTNKSTPAADTKDVIQNVTNISPIQAIPTSVVVPTSPQIDVKPVINPTTGLVMTKPTDSTVFKPVPGSETYAADIPQAAAIAAALLQRDYHSFQQRIRAHEIIKLQQQTKKPKKFNELKKTDNNDKSMQSTFQNFLSQQCNAKYVEENDERMTSDITDADDEDETRYNGFDDIHLVEANTGAARNSNYSGNILDGALSTNNNSGYLSDESQKIMLAQAHANAFRTFEYTLGDFAIGSGDRNLISPNEPNAVSESGEPVYECRHCGKKYRWKSTLRRHENVECGGKEPSHQCPYCSYRSKQRGNLGVHVRKHHAHLPQLASKRRSKYSVKMENENSSIYNGGSDDSLSKLIIDYKN